MNTNSLKRFATTARNILMRGVRDRLESVGFNEDGTVKEAPHSVEGGMVFYGELITDPNFVSRWEALRQRIATHGVKEVVEEAAYTWFNRLMAIRILVRNGLALPALDYENPDVRLPRIVTDARAGKTPVLSASDRTELDRVISNGRLAFEQFAILIRAYCDNNAIIRECFGGITDYTSLLLPADILAPDGFIELLNNADSFISPEDYAKAELIGWLYQFYISERKDEVFAKKGKVEADEIPAATQIFTPNWIVKYMVQNTITGRSGALAAFSEEEIKEKYKYLVLPEEDGTARGRASSQSPQLSQLEDLKVADFACGSGHILNECFDLLMDLYESEFYSPREAIECIFTKNLTGIDIDLRAKQLATFALLLKACQKDASFRDGHCMPHVITIPELGAILKTSKYEDEDGGHGKHIKHIFFRDNVSNEIAIELENAFTLLKDADSLGSIIKFELFSSAREAISKAYMYWNEREAAERPEFVNDILPAIDFILTLTDKYDAIVMNPPYMGGGKMETVLSKYVKENYKDGSADLATVFVEMAPQHLKEGGEYAFIIPPSWMFLSGFEDLRRTIIDNYSIQSLLHLSRGVFGADFGASCAVIKNSINRDFKGTYFRLIERTFQEFDQKHLKELFEKVLENHEFKFLFKSYSKDVESIEYSENGAKIYYAGIDQKQFEKIPGAPIAYWVSEKIFNIFTTNLNVANVANPRKGLATTDNKRFLRYWFEVSRKNFGLNFTNSKLAQDSQYKWFPLNKGGEFRKWFGNNMSVINWFNNGDEIKKAVVELYKGGSYTKEIRSEDKYFQNSITWNALTSGTPSFRLSNYGALFDSAGSSMFPHENASFKLLALLNSPIAGYVFNIINPTLNYGAGTVGTLPVILNNNSKVDHTVNECISISKQDWDAHETSWDFEQSPLLTARGRASSQSYQSYQTIEESVEAYKSKWERMFFQLHANEEELNRQFIEIYGLEEELTPDVPLDEVTILQQGEIKITDQYALTDNGAMITDEKGRVLTVKGKKYLDWQDDVIIKQLISYIVGVWMGRYRLDRPGLHIAHPNPTAEELAEYSFNISGKEKKLLIDQDAIIPVLPNEAPFFDNLRKYVEDFVEKVWGVESKTENLNYIKDKLGKDLNEYLMKDFWKDHKKMYQNRPIYWMFSSNQKGKRAAFQCLVYMHRMNRFTPEHVRTHYLLPYIETLAAREAELSGRASLSAKENKELKQFRADLDECRDYQLRLHEFADRQIEIDLDDGVVKNYATFAPVLARLK